MEDSQIIDQLSTIVSAFTSVSTKSIERIASIVRVHAYEKGETFLEIGKKGNREFFIFDGVCRSFVLNPEGEEMTLAYFLTHEVLSPAKTRTYHQLSRLNLQALTPLTVGSMDEDEFEQLMISHLEIREFGNQVLQRELMKKVEREIGLASLTAKERLLKFREKYYFLENLISHSDIASYLGITNISLSRLRKELK